VYSSPPGAAPTVFAGSGEVLGRYELAVLALGHEALTGGLEPGAVAGGLAHAGRPLTSSIQSHGRPQSLPALAAGTATSRAPGSMSSSATGPSSPW
jgi:hypothetical protein